MAQAADYQKSADQNRAHNLFHLIDKSLTRFAKKASSDDLNQVRYASSKLLQMLSSQEKLHKDIIFKQTGTLETLLSVIQQIPDEQVLFSTTSILNELLGKTQSSKRASVMANHGVTTVLFGLLKQMACQEILLSDETLHMIHSVLSKTGPKDRKFPVKARLHRALLVTLNFVKNNSSNFRVLQPFLQVLKLYTANSVNASYLGKHNAIVIMFRVIGFCGCKYTSATKLALEILYSMTKSKSNSARLIGMGGVPQLLTLHTEWHQADTKNRSLALRKAILNTLKNITNLKSGRRAFVELDGIRILYNTAQEVSENREVEGLVMLSSLIMRKCCPRNRLPVDNVLSAVTFTLPHSDKHTPDCYLLPEFQSALSFTSRQGGDDSDHSSLDDDDDIDSDDERFHTDNQDEPTEDEQGDGLETPETRSFEELRMYDKFFPEMFEFEKCLSNLEQDDQLLHLTQHEESVLSFSEEKKQQAQSFDCYNCVDVETSFTNESTAGGSVPSLERGMASAINIKTGSSVFSLEFPSSTSSGTSTSLPLRNKSTCKPSIQKSAGAKKSKSGAKRGSQVKDRKLRKTPSLRGLEELTAGALCITSLSTPRDLSDEMDQVTTSSSDDTEEDLAEFVHDPQIYAMLAGDVCSVYRFSKMAYPDLKGARGIVNLEPLYIRKFGVQRTKVFEDIDRMIHPECVMDRVVYDLDDIVARAGSAYGTTRSNLSNRDEMRIGGLEGSPSVLRFNALFESGNLRKAIQVRAFEYDLILSPDINTNHHHQWFYFEVSNMDAQYSYRFNIVNCEKMNSQFNFGMQPLMFSVTEAIQGHPGWVRTGTDICYYRNHFVRPQQTAGGVKGKAYYTATFTVCFEHQFDVCYLAYHYPYTYTALRTHLLQWEAQVDHTQMFFRHQTLCETLSANPVPLLTITSQPRSRQKEDLEKFWSRPYIFLTGRVHPGESNSSWVMKGTIDFLMSNKPAALQLREMYIFKIVPMLNPDGVINGNHRCSLVAEDLNRRWNKPCPNLHPTIYHTKGLLQYLSAVNKIPLVFCDYHGHSRRKNIFLYGCSPQMSWLPNDTQNPACTGIRTEDSGFKTLPRLLQLSTQLFCLENCSFLVERVKETTARVVVWRQMNIVRSYTMESSYCGCDQRKYKDQHINTHMLEEMGHKFCECLIPLAKTCAGFYQQLPDFSASCDLSVLENMDDGLPESNMRSKVSKMSDEADMSESDVEQVADEDENYGEDDYAL